MKSLNEQLLEIANKFGVGKLDIHRIYYLDKEGFSFEAICNTFYGKKFTFIKEMYNEVKKIK